MCIKETLTGRSSFSLFGLFVNWGNAGDPGENLLRDARRAGKSVAMVSAGDLTPFSVDVASEELFTERYLPKETRQALEYAKDHDLVIYHYIWHDTQAHHNDVGTPEYQVGLNKMNRVVEQISQGIDGTDMDLIVLGDHGHSDTGLHVHGMDIPTVLVARSPRLKNTLIEGRIPISATRYLSGIIMGLHTDRMEWQSEWIAWSAAEHSPEARQVLDHPPTPVVRDFPLTMVMLCGLLVGLSSWIVGSQWTLLAMVLALLTGAGFETWLQTWHFPGTKDRIFQIWWWVPTIAAALGWVWRRTIWSAWLGALAGSVVSLLVLAPVLHHYGLARNADWVGLPVALGAALTLVWMRFAVLKENWQSPQKNRHVKQLMLALCAGGIVWWGWEGFSGFRVFNFQIAEYRNVGWMTEMPYVSVLSLAGLGILMHFLIDRDANPARRMQWALAAGVGASQSIPLSNHAYIIGFLMIVVGLFIGGKWRSRLLGIGIFWSLPYLYAPENCMGMLAVVAATVVGLLCLQEIKKTQPSDSAWLPLYRWGGGLMMVVGGYLSLVWSYGLSFSGIDFGFFINWLPETGRLHEKLWWLIFLAMLIKVFIPVILMVELCRSRAEDSLTTWLNHGARLGWLRTVSIMVFASTWIVHSGSRAIGLRLAGVVQDGFIWVMLALVLVCLAKAPREDLILEDGNVNAA